MWILKRAKTTTLISRMISHQIFFGQYPDEKQLQRINAIWKKKSGRFKTVEQTMITLELSSDAFACRPFRSLSPLFISSNAKLRRFTYHNHGKGDNSNGITTTNPTRVLWNQAVPQIASQICLHFWW